MWDAVKAGDWERARKRHYELRVLSHLLFAEPSPAPTKACLHLMGRIGPELRSPLFPVSAALVEQLRTELIAKVGDRLSVLSGDDGTSFPLYACGGRGVISVVSNIAPRDMADMWDAVREGQWDRAKKIHFKLRLRNQLLFAEPSPAPTKAALSLLDRCTTDVRLPLVAATSKLVDELRAEMRTQGLL
jgi:dihydrodipicolinate synthase/N-acetylneuraminate lyase